MHETTSLKEGGADLSNWKRAQSVRANANETAHGRHVLVDNVVSHGSPATQKDKDTLISKSILYAYPAI